MFIGLLRNEEQRGDFPGGGETPPSYIVIPVKTGIQERTLGLIAWIPASAGMTFNYNRAPLRILTKSDYNGAEIHPCGWV
jgi:hypothetical protein